MPPLGYTTRQEVCRLATVLADAAIIAAMVKLHIPGPIMGEDVDSLFAIAPVNALYRIVSGFSGASGIR